MSVALGGRFVAQILSKSKSKICPRVTVARWWSTVQEEKNDAGTNLSKTVIPAAEPGRIQAAVLKNFNGPLEIENVDIPKLLEPKEVRNIKSLQKSSAAERSLRANHSKMEYFFDARC